jgi:hypothetical protein
MDRTGQDGRQRRTATAVEQDEEEGQVDGNGKGNETGWTGLGRMDGNGGRQRQWNRMRRRGRLTATAKATKQDGQDWAG